MATFPDITPTARSYEPGIYPQRSYRTLSGALVRRTFGNSPYGARLQLEFANISDDQVLTILNHYRNQTSQNKRFKINTAATNNALKGISNSSTIDIASGNADNLRWEYTQAPQVRSIRPGLSTVTVSLTGEIRNPALDD